jgi:hypothetical protein
MLIRLLLVCIAFLGVFPLLSQTLSSLPIWNEKEQGIVQGDWLLSNKAYTAGVYRSSDNRDVVLYNGLVKRVFRLQPNLACVDYKNVSTSQQLLRAISPEARITIDGQAYAIGGLYGQREMAYLLPAWVDSYTAGERDFRFSHFTVSPLSPAVQWKRRTWTSVSQQPTGKQITFYFKAPDDALSGLEVHIHYEIYDGIPLVVKSLTIVNAGSRAVTLDRIVNEILALVEEESAVVGTPEEMKKQHGLYVETNYAFNNAMRYDISDQTTHWKVDSSYTSQVNYYLGTPCLLEVYPEKVTAVVLAPGERFKSVRTHELLMDSYDRERRGLSIRKMYRMVAPWTTQNPIFMHLVSKTDEEVKAAIDQCAATGYEAVIMSFGSHCNMEDNSAANLSRWKTMADYAHQKGVLLGGYSLFSSRRISDEDDVIDPNTGKPGGAFFGNAPCFGSKWGLAYREKIKLFFNRTGFDIWENDGPYPGDVCASTSHPGHSGLGDSQWRQMEIQKGLYRWLNEQGVYINAPDWYFLDGTHKIALGYREVNFSLSRDQQKILNRQNIYDGLWEKTPSMSWGFVPLTKYQGGGPDAVLEPLHEHLDDYEQLMIQYYGAGVQACYRGPRLYDTEATRELVTRTIAWYQKYRDILNADIIHLRRPDGRDWDGILHVSPTTSQKGFLLLYNPTKQVIAKTITVPLYYTGLTNMARVREKERESVSYNLDREYQIHLPVTIKPEGYTWFVIE